MSDARTKAPTSNVREFRPLGPVGGFVTSRVNALLSSRARSSTTAALARLRANIGRVPGVDATIWDATMAGVPGKPFDDSPTAEEWAAHVALTLFALHQQGSDTPMHSQGSGFGSAVRQLSDRTDTVAEGVGPTRRRFNALVTSATFSELSYHLRSAIKQLRGAGIALDYGRLADDLFYFQLPGRADGVRRAWARQYYRQFAKPTPSDETTSKANLEDQNA